MNEIEVARLAFFILFSCVIILGLIGNVFCLLIWHKGRNSSKIACAAYFKLISVGDIVNLSINGVSTVLGAYQRIFIMNINRVICKLFSFFFLFGFLVPTWILVVLSLERMLSICFPTKFRLTRAKKRAYLSFLIISLIVLGFSSPEVYLADLRQVTYGNITVAACVYDIESPFAKTYISIKEEQSLWFWFLLPLLCVTFCNALIFKNLYCTSKPRNTHCQTGRFSTFTKYCIAVGILHCVSVIPTVVIALNLFDIELFDYTSQHRWLMNLEDFAFGCQFFNSSLNFILYSCCGKSFRNDLRGLFHAT